MYCYFFEMTLNENKEDTFWDCLRKHYDGSYKCDYIHAIEYEDDIVENSYGCKASSSKIMDSVWDCGGHASELFSECPEDDPHYSETLLERLCCKRSGSCAESLIVGKDMLDPENIDNVDGFPYLEICQNGYVKLNRGYDDETDVGKFLTEVARRYGQKQMIRAVQDSMLDNDKSDKSKELLQSMRAIEEEVASLLSSNQFKSIPLSEAIQLFNKMQDSCEV